MIRLKKNARTYKDFDKSFYDVWSEGFINYTAIPVPLFGATVLDLHAVLSIFYTKIPQLAKVYEWQEAIVPLAIEIYTHITFLQLSD